MSIRSLDMTREDAQRKSNEDYMLGRITKEEWDFQFEELGNVRVWNKDGKIHQLKEEHERLRTNNRTTK